MWPAIIGAIGSIAGAGIGAKGQSDANKTNIALAREQMAFQERMARNAESFSERMSSTSIQRAVADYRAAGLNPALAYERGASSPAGVTAGGSQARVENTLRDMPQLASTALQLQQMRQSMKIAQQQSDADLKIKEHTANREQATAENIVAQSHQIRQGSEFQLLEQPFNIRKAELTNILMGLEIPGLRNEAQIQELLGKLSPTARITGSVLKDLVALIAGVRGLRGAQSLTEQIQMRSKGMTHTTTRTSKP